MPNQSTREADARQNPAPARTPRRRGKPWNPAATRPLKPITDEEEARWAPHRQTTADLGVPNYQRSLKGSGFREENLAGGDGPKVKRAVEKMPFTPNAVRIRLVAEEIERSARLKKEPNFQRTQTSIDRALEENEFHSLDWYCENHYRREAGRPAAMRYDDTPRGLTEEANGDDREKRWRVNLNVLEIVDDLLSEAHKAYLDTLVWMAYPGFREGTPPSKLEVGQEISQMKGKDAATGAFVGYTRAVAQAISSARADAIVIMKRRRDARELQMRDERKQRAGALFKVG